MVISDIQLAALKEQHKEISTTVRRTMFLLLAYSAFCIITILQTDVPFILSSGGITLPVVNVSVGLRAFLVAGPLGFLVVAIYLHIFLEKLRQLEPLPQENIMPFIFNFDDRLSNALSSMIFYGLPPALMAAFAWKAAVFPDSNLMLDATAAVTLATIGLVYWRARRRWGSLQTGATIAALSGANLRGADLSEARMINVDLSGACGNDRTKLPNSLALPDCPDD